MDREDAEVAGLQMPWEEVGTREYVECWALWGWFLLDLSPVLSTEPYS